MKTIPFAQRDVAVLRTVDAVVLGGSLAGVAAANELAETGWQVALVEPRTYLGWEMSATLRPWLPVREGKEQAYAAAPLLQAFVEEHDLQPVNGELPLSLYELKRFLEDRLLAAGVEIIYASTPVGGRQTAAEASLAEGNLDGVVIGNKSGRQMLQAGVVLDAQRFRAKTSDFLEKSDVSQETTIYARTLEFDGVGVLEGKTLDVPNDLGLVDDQVRLHQGYRGAGHLLVECRMQMVASNEHEAASLMRIVSLREALEGRARRVTTRVAAYLMQNVDAFGEATLADASHEIYGPVGSESIDDPLIACADGTEVSRQVLRGEWPETEAPGELDSQRGSTSSAQDVPGLEIRETPGPQAGKRHERARGKPAALPVIDEVDVLVVGGGTSGATAAMVAGRGGVSTALVEMNPGLGGTGTYGGVHSYWFGRRVGFAAEVTRLATDLHHKLRQPPPEGAVPRWNIEAKSQALRQAVEEAGVALYLNAMVIGTVVERDLTGFRNLSGLADATSLTAVKGVALATREGAGVILAQVVIDATGDGDVAAHAGAGATYGAARDHVVMWYSLAQFARPGRTRNNFTSMVDVSNVQDYTRAILAGRRRRRERDHDHGVYVATRESRHIRGKVELTLNDQLLQRRWRDVINIAFSNHDVKGHSTSDWVRLGLIPPNLEVEIPYRALLPVGLKNILVVGKAISASHDALPAIRMQADMENLGGAAALAAAFACRHECSVQDVDVAEVQETLIAAGVLPPEIRTRQLQPWRLEGEALAKAVAALDGRPLISYADMEMDEVYRQRILPVDVCCAGPEAIGLLERELEREDLTGFGNLSGRDENPRALLMAQLLCLLGSRAGAPLLVAQLSEALSGQELPARSSHIRYAGAPPDQGAMPQEVYWLHALGMARDKRAIPVWQRVVDLLATATEEDVASGVKGVFYYVEAVCAGTERLGSREAAPLLRQLHGYAPFHGLVCRQGFEVDHFPERRAYLELLIARALARCGSPHGAAVLINYLDDVRALLARHAHSELMAISGQDVEAEAALWSQWLETQGDELTPKPYDAPAAPREVWGEEVLVDGGRQTTDRGRVIVATSYADSTN